MSSSTSAHARSDSDYVRLLGDAIRSQRQHLGLSQENFAQRIAMDRGYMGGVERGEHNLTFGKLMQVLDGLDADPVDFFRDIQLVGLEPALPAQGHGKELASERAGDTYAERLGAALRRERGRAGFTQEAFAIHLGLGRAYLSGVENGARNVTFTQLLRILRGLGLQPAVFFSYYFPIRRDFRAA
jgi:transcriptional regulator with XRE-family HTH domain